MQNTAVILPFRYSEPRTSRTTLDDSCMLLSVVSDNDSDTRGIRKEGSWPRWYRRPQAGKRGVGMKPSQFPPVGLDIAGSSLW